MNGSDQAKQRSDAHHHFEHDQSSFELQNFVTGAGLDGIDVLLARTGQMVVRRHDKSAQGRRLFGTHLAQSRQIRRCSTIVQSESELVWTDLAPAEREPPL